MNDDDNDDGKDENDVDDDVNDEIDDLTFYCQVLRDLQRPFARHLTFLSQTPHSGMLTNLCSPQGSERK